ncbi:LysR substrate-binding domain-containing protein [Streptomyces sp. WMMC940]|nr:LysR substrate-binding domain-containing protein [Streptomyces sp. WMMC940]MCZ7456250.1 LysR substrate-binding domain-containing protein [Streptomyces sp. WMMC940]
MARLRTERPGVPVDLELCDLDDPFAEVARGRTDLAPVRAGRGVRTVLLLDDSSAAVLPRDRPLARGEVVDLNGLAGEPWVGSEPPVLAWSR